MNPSPAVFADIMRVLKQLFVDLRVSHRRLELAGMHSAVLLGV